MKISTASRKKVLADRIVYENIEKIRSGLEGLNSLLSDEYVVKILSDSARLNPATFGQMLSQANAIYKTFSQIQGAEQSHPEAEQIPR